MLKIELEIESDIPHSKSPFQVLVKEILSEKAVVMDKDLIIIPYTYKNKPLYTIKIKKAEQI